MTRYMHASIKATYVAKSHLPKRKTKKKCIPYVSVLPFQPRSFPSQFRPEGRWLAWSDNQKLLTQVVMLLWPIVWEEMGKPIYESRVTGCLVIGILSLTSSSSYTSLRKSHTRIN